MKLDMNYLKKKLRTLDREALLRLREMMRSPEYLKSYKKPLEKISSKIGEGLDLYREDLKGRPLPWDVKEQYESQGMFLELKLHDVVDKKAEKNIKEILEEIDKILEELPLDKKESNS